jgi:hypothetical protein
MNPFSKNLFIAWEVLYYMMICNNDMNLGCPHERLQLTSMQLLIHMDKTELMFYFVLF